MPFQGLKVGELAKRTGLTIRALHHYDAIGLLKPSGHTESGHRLYQESDIARLQHLISLRELGFSLEEIRVGLDRDSFSFPRVVEAHLSRLREQIALQNQLLARLEGIASHLRTAEKVSADDFLRTLEVISAMEKLYTSEQWKQFQDAKAANTPEAIRSVEEGWLSLFLEIRSQYDLDPASPQAQSLADRWDRLTEETMKGFEAFPDLQGAISENYRKGNFQRDERIPQPEDLAFIDRVKKARIA